MYKLNNEIAWKKKNNTLVVYNDFNYYFFKDKSKEWTWSLIKNEGNKIKKIPKDFIEYLLKRKIIIK